jgi:hypothetical protein
MVSCCGMGERFRGDIAARVFLTLRPLRPYWRLLTIGVIYLFPD